MLDKDRIMGILYEWNYWDKVPAGFIPRPDYAKKIESFRKTGDIIVLFGVRRSGKSTLLRQEIKSLLRGHDKKQVLFVNLEDPRFSQFLNTELLDDVFNTYKERINPDNEIFVFLDEIQNIPGWEKWVRTKHELKQAHIYITGSSSKLLGREIGTVLSGRYLAVEVYPLSFREFLAFNGIPVKSSFNIIKHKAKIKNLFQTYVLYGGFPKVALLSDENKLEELQNYFQSILLRDIVARYHLKDFLKLEQTTNYLLSNTSKLYSANKIRQALDISLESVLNYVSYLREALLVFELSKFSYSIKEQISSKKKIYCVDIGIVNFASFRFSDNTGRMLENVVFLKLLAMKKEVYYHSGRNECDFLVKEGNKIRQAIQVCAFLDKDNEKREIKGLVEALDNFNLKEGVILTSDQEKEFRIKNRKIKAVPVWKWLLEE